MKVLFVFFHILWIALPAMAHPGHGTETAPLRFFHYLIEPIHVVTGLVLIIAGYYVLLRFVRRKSLLNKNKVLP